jgi:hypothetical protein
MEKPMRYSVIAIAACCLLIASPGLTAEETAKPDEQLAEELARSEIEMRAIKEAQCMKAIGAKEFCSCIADESPSGIDFVDYVRIVSDRSAPISADDKALVEASMDKCASVSAEWCK